MAGPSPDMTLKAARELLGVGPSATAGDIRRAFRDAAKRAHPDRPGGGADQFRQVVEAHRRLQAAFAGPDPLFQPPTSQNRSAEAGLEISPLLALNGGALEHALADGRRIRIQLPPGLRTGDSIRAGEARLPVIVRGDSAVMVRGDDLWITAPIAPRVLAEGGRVSLDTPLGRRVVWITKKAGEQGLVRLPGQGLPARGRHPQGHLFLRLSPQAGQEDGMAKSLLRRFAAAWAA